MNEYIPNLRNKIYQDYIFKKWKYSKVKENTEVDKKNKAIIVGDKELPIIIAGDGVCVEMDMKIVYLVLSVLTIY